MVLGLIDFLLGGKKKTKVPRTGQVTTPLNSVGGNASPGNVQNSPGPTIPNGQNIPTQNAENLNVQPQESQSQSNELKFESSTPNPTAQPVQPQQVGNKKSISEVIHKIHDELKGTNEKITDLVTDIKSLENTVNTLGHRIDDLEEAKKESDDKILEIDRNMTKFLSLYELINNQYNPFVEQEKSNPKEIVVNENGNSNEENSNNSIPTPSFDELKQKFHEESKSDLDSTLLNLDTLNIEDAAGDAVPLVSLKNNTNSLVTILSWLEYLIKREGIEKARDSLRYYTETLRWITPEVFFDLDKYLRGMKDRKDLTGDESLTVRDHIVSLYFISKLNEKVLDENLTRAVLQIIKEK